MHTSVAWERSCAAADQLTDSGSCCCSAQNFCIDPLPFPPEELAIEYTQYWHPPATKKEKQKWAKQVRSL